VGDLNGDGLDDIASVGGSDVVVYLALGGGTFAPPINVLDGGPTFALTPHAAVVGTFSSTNQAVLAVAANEGGGSLIAELNYAGGVFSPSVTPLQGAAIPAQVSAMASLPIAAAPSALFLTAPGDYNVYLFSNGSLSTPFEDDTVTNGFGPIAVADFNGDGLSDVVLGAFNLLNKNSDNLVYILNQVPGTTPPTFVNHQTLSNFSAPIGVAAADFDGDGIPDVAVITNTGQAGTPGSLLIYAGDGQGGVTPIEVALLTTDEGANSIAIGDFDGDGWPDIAVACSPFGSFPGYVDVFLNGGCGANFAAGAPAIRLPTVSAYPVAIATGHLSEPDGGQDIAIADDPGAGVFRGFTNLCLGAPPYVPHWDAGAPLPGVSSVADVISDDFNQDGIPDLAIATADGGYVLYGQDAGGYATPEQVLPPLGSQQFGSESVASALTTGDFWGDGTVDLAAALFLGPGPQQGYEMAVTYQQDGGFPSGLGALGFQGAPGDGGALLLKLVSAHFRTDTTDSVLFTSAASNVIEKLNSQEFSAFATVTASNTGLYAIATGDFNGDQQPDFIASGFDTATSNSDTRLHLLVSDGGALYTQSQLDAGPGIVALAVADFNQDGHLDFAAASQTADEVDVYFGDGTGTFTAPESLPTGAAGPTALVAADFNGDGLPDLAVLTLGHPDVIDLFYNQGCGAFTLASSLSAPGNGPGSLCTVADPLALGGADLVVAIADGGTSIWVPGY
jgi:hypothetical protein